MTLHDEYAIGSADSFGVVVYGGIVRIEYDMKQVQEEGFAKYNVHGPRGDQQWAYETNELGLGDRISVAIANDAAEKLYMPAKGWVVNDRMLAVFNDVMDEPVYRERKCRHRKI